MIQFFTHPVSNYCAKVEIVLRIKGLAFESLAPPGGYGSASYKAIVPAGTIPAIVDDGLVLSESDTINEYLEEACPDPPLLPADPRGRARCRQIARFHDTRLEPPLRALFAVMAPDARDPALIRAKLLDFHLRLEDLAALTSPAPWLAGERLTLADAAYPATLQLADLMTKALGERLQLPDPLEAWAARVREHDAVAPVLAASRVATEAWLRGKGALG